MKIAILLCGHVRSWNYTRENFIQTFLNQSNHTVDIFVHTYTKQFEYHPYIHQTYQTPPDVIIVPELNIPCKAIIVEDSDQVATIVREEQQSGEFQSMNEDLYSQFRNFRECDRIRRESGEYDLVIKTRFDITYSMSLNEMLQQIDLQTIHKIYIACGPGTYPCDRIFIASGRTMSEFSEQLTRPTVDTKIDNPHTHLNNLYSQNLQPIALVVPIVRMGTNQ